jgi:hypothetical protein
LVHELRAKAGYLEHELRRLRNKLGDLVRENMRRQLQIDALQGSRRDGLPSGPRSLFLSPRAQPEMMDVGTQTD